jgi:hypothetical protein
VGGLGGGVGKWGGSGSEGVGLVGRTLLRANLTHSLHTTHQRAPHPGRQRQRPGRRRPRDAGHDHAGGARPVKGARGGGLCETADDGMRLQTFQETCTKLLTN